MSRKAVIVCCAAVVPIFGIAVANINRDPLPESARADYVLVLKSEHRLDLLSGGNVLKSYRVALGRGGAAAKQRQGDHLTPEGVYILDRRNTRSRFYRSIHVSYPNPADRERARRMGADPGGDIMVHGVTNGLGWLGALHRTIDWTDGCVAVTDSQMDEIWRAVPDGTPIEIRH